MSLKINLHIEGLKEFTNGCRKLSEALEKQLHNRLVSWVNMVKEEAQMIVPVRTGYLRSTIYAEVKKAVASIGASATYAVFVERGTRKMMARPYLEPAIKMHLPTLEQYIVDAVEAAKREVGFT